MKSLRLGNFRSFLEMLGPDEPAEADRRSAPHADAQSQPRTDSLFGQLFDRTAENRPERHYVPLDRLARLYGEQQPEGVQPPWPADDAAIAAELRLGSARTGEDLRRIRRSFAMRNHPDRVPAWLRAEATRRMTIANALIDGAMRSRAKKSFLS
jgi:hypothetical protein